jgi:hypothetical protein
MSAARLETFPDNEIANTTYCYIQYTRCVSLPEHKTNLDASTHQARSAGRPEPIPLRYRPSMAVFLARIVKPAKLEEYESEVEQLPTL